MSTPYTFKNYDFYSNFPCSFCGKNDIVKNMYITTLVDGKRVFPVNPENITFLCEWCAHFDDKESMRKFTYWLLDLLQYLTVTDRISEYQGVF